MMSALKKTLGLYTQSLIESEWMEVVFEDCKPVADEQTFNVSAVDSIMNVTDKTPLTFKGGAKDADIGY